MGPQDAHSACCPCVPFGFNVNLWSQSTPALNGIRGYLDPRTGDFSLDTASGTAGGGRSATHNVCRIQLHNHRFVDSGQYGEDRMSGDSLTGGYRESELYSRDRIGYSYTLGVDRHLHGDHSLLMESVQPPRRRSRQPFEGLMDWNGGPAGARFFMAWIALVALARQCSEQHR